MQDDERLALAPYEALMTDFLSGGIDGPAFEEQFLDRYKADPFLWSEPVFAVLDGLFADVDSYVADDELRDPGDLDEDGLREAAERARTALQGL